jgi:hypothetical protein
LLTLPPPRFSWGAVFVSGAASERGRVDALAGRGQAAKPAVITSGSDPPRPVTSGDAAAPPGKSIGGGSPCGPCG